MRICAYRTYATRSQVLISGRVLANKAPGSGRGSDGFWGSLVDGYRRFATDEVPHLPVTIRFEGRDHPTETDGEGYYHLELPRQDTAGEGWLNVEARCTVRGREISAMHEVVAPSAGAEFGVISDLDDTVIETNITNMLTAAKLTFMGNAKTRKPLKGVAAFYSSLASGRAGQPLNPIFYVSSSPWNLYDLLCEFMELNEIPKGPIFLRDYGVGQKQLFGSLSHRGKLERTLAIMAAFPHLPFVLIGDSGQQDAGLYAEAATLHPDRIKAIYIRDVDPATATKRDDQVREHIATAAQRGVPMVLAPDSEAMARHTAELGLISARKEAQVQVEVAKDHERPKPAAAAVSEALGIASPAKKEQAGSE